jgi:hypothetical protein
MDWIRVAQDRDQCEHGDEASGSIRGVDCLDISVITTSRRALLYSVVVVVVVVVVVIIIIIITVIITF